CPHGATHAPPNGPACGRYQHYFSVLSRRPGVARLSIFAPGRRLPLDPTEETDMTTGKMRFRHTLPALALVAALAGPGSRGVIADWKAKAEIIAIEKRMLPPPNARGMAMLHVAMFEAVNAVERRYSPYKLTLPADRTASKEAAAATAAHGVLSALHP